MAKITLIHDADTAPERPKPTGSGGNAPFRYIGDEPLVFPQMLAKGILPLTGVALLAGQFSSGKTFIAIDLALSLIYGVDFLGRKVKPGGVLWLAAEGGGELESRVFAARRGKFEDDSNEPLPLFWRDTTPNGATETILAEIKAMIRSAQGECEDAWDGLPLRLVVIDTFAAGLAIKDENDNAEAAGIMKRLAEVGNELGVLIMPVAHLGKNADSGVRGASAYGGGSDAILSVTADINQLTGSCGDRGISLSKTRRGTPGPLASFDLVPTQIGYDEDRDPVTSCYVSFDKAEAVGKAKPIPRHVRVLLNAINEAMQSRSEMIQVYADSPPRKVALVDHVRSEFYRAYTVGDSEASTEAKRKAYNRAYQAVMNGGQFASRTVGLKEYLWPVQT